VLKPYFQLCLFENEMVGDSALANRLQKFHSTTGKDWMGWEHEIVVTLVPVVLLHLGLNC
jgi:hypothetical protein